MSSSVRKRWLGFHSWPPWRIAFWAFALLIVAGAALLVASLTCWKTFFNTTDRVTLLVGLLTGTVVVWQGQLLNRQLAYGTVLDLYKEWSSESMLAARRNAWSMDKEEPDRDAVEDVLEFLEKVSTLEKDRYIGLELIWDTFGWYIGRYYFYSKTAIEYLRTKWTPRHDPTLYQDLERLYPILQELEVERRNEKRKPDSKLLTRADIEDEYRQTRKMFIASEVDED